MNIFQKVGADMNLNEGGYIFIVCIYVEQENIKCTLHIDIWIGRKYILIHNFKWSSKVYCPNMEFKILETI